jgi:hypothetical protein
VSFLRNPLPINQLERDFSFTLRQLDDEAADPGRDPEHNLRWATDEKSRQDDEGATFLTIRVYYDEYRCSV